jgi:predicted dehydrogenase
MVVSTIRPTTALMKTTTLPRREFLSRTAVSGAVLAATTRLPQLRAADAPSRRVRVGVMGLGRGMAHVNGFLAVPGVEVAYVCDVDRRRAESAAAAVAKKQASPTQAVGDFRRILEDPNIDAISIAAPNFWHAPATILACAAGKHVYVEKPGSHNAREGELMVEAARKHNRLVQMGNQRRSTPWIIEAVGRLRAGEIGTLRAARTYYANARATIGVGKVAPVPEWLDYNLWQGPVPDRPFKDNLLHYNWHWMWHWGGGELANNGIHTLDLARWGLGVEYPSRVSFGGARLHFQDDQETPDTGTAFFDFGHCMASWETSSCHPRKPEEQPLCKFYGEGGTLTLGGKGYTIDDIKGKQVAKVDGATSDVPHFTNFVEAIRGNAQLNSPISEGQKSTLLCHLGNIAWRTSSTLTFDPKARKIVGNTAATALWGREYRPGWEPKV